MYETTDWREIARELRVGERRRATHGCDTDRSLIVSRDASGASAYCFRCGHVGFQPAGTQSLSALREQERESNRLAAQQHTLEIPHDFTNEIPPEGEAWLTAGGSWAGHGRHSDIGYSPSLRRVVLVCRDASGAVVYWQARAIYPGQYPKYVNPSASKEVSCIWVPGPPDVIREGCVVITEDYLSANRVGRHVQACTALGTKLSVAQAQDIANRAVGRRIYVWLDPDSAGREGSTAMRRKLSLLSDDIQIIESSHDPKAMNDRTIRSTLGLQPTHNQRYTCWT